MEQSCMERSSEIAASRGRCDRCAMRIADCECEEIEEEPAEELPPHITRRIEEMRATLRPLPPIETAAVLLATSDADLSDAWSMTHALLGWSFRPLDIEALFAAGVAKRATEMRQTISEIGRPYRPIAPAGFQSAVPPSRGPAGVSDQGEAP